MGATTAADLANGQIAMVGAARYTYEHRTLTPQLFTKMTLGPGEKSGYIPKFGTVTANDLTDGIDMNEAQALTISGTTHSTDEAGCKVIITKKLRNQLKEDAYRAAGKVIGNAMAKKIDQDGLTLFSGLDTVIGGAGTAISLDYLQAAISQCYGQSEPVPDPLVTVIHPFHLHEFVDLLATPAASTAIAPELQAGALASYFRGTEKLFGSAVYATGNISVDSSDDAYGAVFSKLAFIYLVGWEPENWVEEDKSLRGWEIGIVADYGMVEEDGTYGRALLFDATAPVS